MLRHLFRGVTGERSRSRSRTTLWRWWLVIRRRSVVLKSEVAKVLAYVSGADRWEPNELSVEVWLDLLGGLSFEDAMAAVRAHYREEHRPIYPADVLERVRLASVPEGEEWLAR
jgi:hypothetical protein